MNIKQCGNDCGCDDCYYVPCSRCGEEWARNGLTISGLCQVCNSDMND